MSTLSTERIHFEDALLVLLEGLGAGTGAISPSRMALINYVKAKLDEVIPAGEGITFSLSAAPNVSNPLDLLINAHIDETTKDIQLSAPISVLVPENATAAGVSFTDPKTGYVILPNNFLRLSSFKMTDWQRKLDEGDMIDTKSPKYNRQSNKYLRGTTSKPIGVLTWKNTSTGGLKTISLVAGGTGFVPGVNILTVVQSGGLQGTIIVTASAGGIITSVDSIVTAGDGYTVATPLATTGGAGNGCTVNVTAINGIKRIIEYYSINTVHTVDELLYIPERLAEDLIAVNPNLMDALAWQCAGKIMQITGMMDASKIAQERVTQSLNFHP